MDGELDETIRETEAWLAWLESQEVLPSDNSADDGERGTQE